MSDEEYMNRGWCEDTMGPLPSNHEPVKRYEGHTPEPWEWKTTPGSDHERCTVFVKNGRAVARHVALLDAPLIADAPMQAATITRLTAFCDEFVWGEENPKEYQTLYERCVLLQDLLREFSHYLDRLPKNEDTQILASKLHTALAKEGKANAES